MGDQRACAEHKKMGSKHRHEDVYFNKVIFWVQIHDLGLEKFSTENAWKIGNQIGQCREIEHDIETTKKSYMRMKVQIYVNELLMAGLWWTISQGEDI